VTDQQKPDQTLTALEEANEQGFLGEEVDQTPNEAYTVAGQASGEAAQADYDAKVGGNPTEGTDAAAAKAASKPAASKPSSATTSTSSTSSGSTSGSKG
jgi:hypothetical protein